MMKIPNQIKIGWKDVDIETVKVSFVKNNSDYWGQYLVRQNKIEIQEEAKGQDLANTLVHEIIHAIVYHSSLNADGGPLSDDEDEEQTVNSMTNWLMGVFKDNPWLLDFLMLGSVQSQSGHLSEAILIHVKEMYPAGALHGMGTKKTAPKRGFCLSPGIRTWHANRSSR